MRSFFASRKTFFTLLILILLGAFFAWPLPAALTHPVSHEPLRILDRSGKLLYEAREPDFGALEKISLAEIPKQFTDALLVSEDRNFYAHSGISLRGITRAAYQNFRAGKIVEGGSTLTQQLVRNRIQPATRDVTYKLAEMYFALRLEMRMDKNEILEEYLNTAYFGHQAYGVASAAKTYFAKTAGTLSLAESALLAGLVQAPTTLDPFSNLAKAQARQKLILDTLREEAEITAEEHATARAEKITLAPDQIKIRAPHFVMALLNNNFEAFDKSVNNSREIRTTLDLDLQTESEAIVTRELAKLHEKNVTNAAVVVIDARTGELLTLVGSANYFDDAIQGKVNVAISARQPGSALKPFVYALALARDETPATTVADVAAQFATAEGNPYTPRNYDYADHGLVRYREALANSYNIAAVKVLERVGVARTLNFLARAGITTLTRAPEYYGLALALGAGEVRLLELTRAYGVFANAGKTLPLSVLCDQTESDTSPCSLRDTSSNPKSKILNPSVAWLIADILADNDARLPQFGDDSPLNFDFPVAAKTGTTRNSRDNWTFGFTPERIVGVWVGNADNTPMRGTSGVTGAGPIFHAVMEAALRGQPKTWFPRPNEIVEKEICALSGKLPTLFCPHTLREFFSAGTEPKKEDEIFQAVKIDTRNNLRAGENCATHFFTEKVFADFPLELKTWARENGYAEAPTRYSPFCPRERNEINATQIRARIEITRPNAGDSFQLDPLIPSAEQKIIFTASADAEIEVVEWFVNGARVGVGNAPEFRFDWEPSVGTHTLTVRGGDLETELKFEINPRN